MTTFAKMGDVIKFRFKVPPMFTKDPGEGVEVLSAPLALDFGVA